MAAAASIFVASTPSTITISGSEQSNFFSSPVDPSDYSITLGFDLNRWFNTLTLGPLPITDTVEILPAVAEENLAQGSSTTGSNADDWYTRLRQLKQGDGSAGVGWGDMKDDDSANLLASTQMIVFKKRMEHVLNSLFGTSTVSNTRPLKEDKIKEWLEQAGRFEAAVFTPEQFTFLRAMFVHAEKYDTITHKLKLEVGDKMGVVVEISTTEPGDAAVNMITVNLFIEQELDERLAAFDYASAAASAAADAATQEALVQAATTVLGAEVPLLAVLQYYDNAVAASGDAQDVTGHMLRYVNDRDAFVAAAGNSMAAAEQSALVSRVKLSQIAQSTAESKKLEVIQERTDAQTAATGATNEATKNVPNFATASTKALLAESHATNAESLALEIRAISDKALELAPGEAGTTAATIAATQAEVDAGLARTAADSVVGHIIS